MKKNLYLLISIFLTQTGLAQSVVPMHTVTFPGSSPKASITQYIGLSKITIDYARPGAKGRKIFGGLVPYNNGKPIPWRAGADENTTIEFEHKVKIDGTTLEAGRYAIHVIPDEESWVFILSKNFTSWGSFSYRQDEDAIRISAKPKTIPSQEWLSYDFNDLTDSTATISLKWETLEAGFSIKVDSKEITLKNIRNELRNTAGFTWVGYNSAAVWCLQNNVNLQEALTWANRAASNNPGYTTISTKAAILEKLGRDKESADAYQSITELGSYNECLTYAGSLIRQSNKTQANVVINSINDRFNSQKARTYLAVGNFYRQANDIESATKSFNEGLKVVKNEEQKNQLTKAISDLKK